MMAYAANVQLVFSLGIFLARTEMASAKAPAISHRDICNTSFKPVWLDRKISSYRQIGSSLLSLKRRSGPPALLTYFHVRSTTLESGGGAPSSINLLGFTLMRSS